MTQLTTLTRAQVRAVLLGLAEHSSGTEADSHRLGAVLAMADALTATEPLGRDEESQAVEAAESQFRAMRSQLAEALGHAAGQIPSPGWNGLLEEVRALAVPFPAAVRDRPDVDAEKRLTSAGRRIEAVRQLHPRVLIGADDSGRRRYCCSTCNADAAVAGSPAPWPCPTIRALDGAQ